MKDYKPKTHRDNLDNVYTLQYTERDGRNYHWDSKKNTTNFKKHDVWFEEAQTIWADARSIEYFDREHSNNEERFIRIGRTDKSKILLVVFCE